MLYFPAEQNVLTSLRAKKVPSPFSLFHSMGHVYLVQLDCLWDYSALVHIQLNPYLVASPITCPVIKVSMMAFLFFFLPYLYQAATIHFP